MAREFSAASSQFLARTSATVASVPITMACWFYSTSNTTIQTLMEISRSGTGGAVTDKYRMIIRGDLAAPNKTIQVQQLPGGIATTAAEYSVNKWHHACGVFANTANRTVYIDGSNSGNNTTSGSPGTLSQTIIAAAFDHNTQAYVQAFSGRIAEAAIWSVELTAAEVAALARGFTPLQIRPQSLAAYWPLGGHYGQNDLDRWKSKLDLTPNNSPTWENHDKIIYPRVQNASKVSVAAGGATPWLYACRMSRIIGGGVS